MSTTDDRSSGPRRAREAHWRGRRELARRYADYIVREQVGQEPPA